MFVVRIQAGYHENTSELSYVMIHVLDTRWHASFEYKSTYS